MKLKKYIKYLFCSAACVVAMGSCSDWLEVKPSNQIAADVKQELSAKLEEFSNFADTLEETFENREQIEISRHYEKLPKPTLVAIKEFQNGEVYYRKIENKSDKN